ncbi:Uncharacterised protein [Yersinia kristensenii]|uniref:Uncharacterized protein n=1 Tax=Yersinia kristensenii TaxID=28152 RepID=A0A0T9LZX0_YERKR|nr:Uncharacterised protein [Yersinia kristensenii]
MRSGTVTYIDQQGSITPVSAANESPTARSRVTYFQIKKFGAPAPVAG